MRRVGVGEALFRLCLRTYPTAFRRRFGEGMQETFREGLARAQGRGERLAFLARSCADVALSGIRERWSPTFRPRGARGTAHRRGSPADVLRQDLRFALRSLLRRPGFTAAIVLTLALGVGANTAIFSVVNGVLLRPLPWAEPDRLVTVWSGTPADPKSRGSMSLPNIEDLARPDIFEALVGHTGGDVALTGMGEAEVIAGARVSDGILRVFGIAPLVGRDLGREDAREGAPPVVVLGHAFWVERMGAEREVVGRSIDLAGAPHEVVGVAPPGFDYPNGARLWRPHPALEDCGRDCNVYRATGRLAAGVDLEVARLGAEALAARLEAAYPEANHEKTFRLVTLEETLVGDARAGLWMLLGAVGLVLLIACANVANLLIVRGQSRTNEVAVRAALGAGRGRLVGQLLLECLLLAVAGGLVGLALAAGGVDLLRRVSPGTVPRIDEVGIDSVVLLFTLGTVGLVTLFSGLGPALHLARSAPAEELAGGRRSVGETARLRRSRSLLLASEVALSLVLLSGAGLLLGSFARIRAVDPGYETRHVLRFSLSLPAARYGDLRSVADFYRELEERLRALPGVRSVGSVWGAPVSAANATASLRFEGRPEPTPATATQASLKVVTAGYLDAMRIPVLRGRGIEASDGPGEIPVAVVNEAFVRENLPKAEPIGERFTIGVDFGRGSPLWTIVGVVPDVRTAGPRAEPVPEVYVPHPQMGPSFMTVNLRMEPGAPAVVEAVRPTVAALDAALPLRDVETMAEALARQTAPVRFHLLLLAIFAGVAVALAAVGLYGVVAYLVSRRTREIGVRMALGARRSEVTTLVLSHVARPVALGMALGMAGAWIGSRALSSLLFGVEPGDPAVLAAAGALLLVVSLTAALVPARRAALVDPSLALREE